MQNEMSKPAVLAVLVLATFSCTALAQPKTRQQTMITKAPPKALSKYIANAEVQKSALPFRNNNARTRTTPGYIAPEPSASTYTASASQFERTRACPLTARCGRYHEESVRSDRGLRARFGLGRPGGKRHRRPRPRAAVNA